MDDYLSIEPQVHLINLTVTRLYVKIIPMYAENLEITTETVMKALACSRQYVSELVKKGRLVSSGKRGKSNTFRFSELSKVISTERYLDWVIRIDKLLTRNVPEVFEERKSGWKGKGKDEVGK